MSQTPHIIGLPDLASLPDHAPAIAEIMERQGFCVVRGLPNDGDSIHALAQHFGDVQRHIRADGRGVVGDEPLDLSWKNYLAEYNGVSSEEFMPHTDGSFVDGMLVEGDRAKRITAPRLLLLQIARRAERGGDNLVADGGAILDHLARAEPDMAKTLLRPGCITISRDDQMALEAAVFEPGAHGRLKMRFRYDDKVYTPSWSREAVTRFHRLTLDPRFSQEISADEGDILVLDNWRVLHGRTVFRDASPDRPRKFRRVWISDEDTEILENMADQPHPNRSQEVYRPYTTIPSPVPAERMIRFPCGIVPPPGMIATPS